MVLWVKLCSWVASPPRASSIRVAMSSAVSTVPSASSSSPWNTLPPRIRTGEPSWTALRTSAPTLSTITTPALASRFGPRFG